MTACLWPIEPTMLEAPWADLEPVEQDTALALASATLHRLTGGRVGHCATHVRPCKPRSTPFTRVNGGYPWDMLALPGQSAYWIRSCGCTDLSCECTTACEVDLPGPVGRLDEVLLDGAVLDPADYEVHNGHLLVYTGAATECPFPADQDLSKPVTDPGTFQVTYLNAHPVDSMGRQAVTVLAQELAKARTGRGCRLPTNVQTIARQGITMTIGTGTFPDGTTGLREVDTYIALWNPGGLRRQATVWTPDQPTYRTRTL